MYDFFDALITLQSSSEEAYRKFEELAGRTSKILRKLVKNVEKGKSLGQDVSRICGEYEDVLATYASKTILMSYPVVCCCCDWAIPYRKYVPVIMAQAKIFWDEEKYQKVEKIFRKSVEFCRDVHIWKLNVAHVIFMQEHKFKEAGKFYHEIVKKNYNHVSQLNRHH